jgi:hypothetical protein
MPGNRGYMKELDWMQEEGMMNRDKGWEVREGSEVLSELLQYRSTKWKEQGLANSKNRRMLTSNAMQKTRDNQLLDSELKPHKPVQKPANIMSMLVGYSKLSDAFWYLCNSLASATQNCQDYLVTEAENIVWLKSHHWLWQFTAGDKAVWGTGKK